MTWVSLAFFVAAAIIVARIYFKLRNIRDNKQESWDAKIIEQLRAKGYAPFNEYKVDFFMALPDESACQAVRSRLEAEGFSIDAKPMTEKTDLAYSLHASKSMRLIVPDMQAMSERLTTLAAEFGGRYDGWTA
ncbi:MAG: ribonuclease E inhibitor RraB [Proteobacteria bacterium]|nr:ribonuclease E inhibitor RraB [Pseudomonadota bacterium]